jgi:PAS domain S-box-containing protein
MADGGTLPGEWQAAAFQQLADASLDGVWACDRDLRCLYWNRAMERLSQLPAPRALGYDIVEVLAGVGIQDAAAAIQQVLQDGAGSSSDAVGRGAGPAGGNFDSHYLSIRSDRGSVVGVVAIVRDVSEENRIRQELRETDARFRNMADASPVLLWMTRTDGLGTFFNQTWLEFTGRTIEEEWGVGWAENVHFEDLEDCMDTYLKAFNARQKFEMEYRLRRRDGDYRWILDRGTPRYAPDGQFAGYIGSCVDITERRALEAELRGAIEARDDFLSVASHELGTPLTALKLHVEQLQRTVATRGPTAARSTALEDRVGLVAAEVERLGQLVATLLDTTRLAVGAWKLRLERLELGELADQVVRNLTPVADAAKCSVIVQHGSPSFGLWDRVRLEQALGNVLGNAFKFGAGHPVEVTFERQGSSVVVRVRDHGVGLPADEQEVIFQRLGRAKHTRGYGGLGLGLWIARQSVEAMGGTIRVRSAPGEGATFDIVLPCETD